MKRFLLPLIALALTQAAQPARAQAPYTRPQTNPYGRPALSPYLNLLRDGNPAVNYYGLVRPQQNTQDFIQQQQQYNLAALSAPANAYQTVPVPDTGHPTLFQSHAKYFSNIGGFGGVTYGGANAGGLPVGGLPAGQAVPPAGLTPPRRTGP